MRYLVRFLVFGGIAYGGWLYYWAKLHCLEYDHYGACLQRCETWEGSTCVQIRGKKGEVSRPKKAPESSADLWISAPKKIILTEISLDIQRRVLLQQIRQ